MNAPDSPINGNLLRLQRESRGWTLNDMAHRSCLSIKQVQQLEEGGSESFYSEAVKLTAAKKVASLLGLSAAQAMREPAPTLATSVDSLLKLQPTPPNSDGEVEEDRNADVNAPSVAPSIEPASPKSARTSLWVMVGLFVAALALAAWMNPRTELVTSEPEPPPLQTLPAEASEPASSMAVVASEPAEPASR
jgi:transcriptional regulator with XRE-family HTH domain